jgi:hypothetical protein
MTFLESVGDRAGALRSYDEFVVYLSGEFDATPDPDTAALRNNIRDGNVTHVEPAANEPAAPTPPAVPTSPIAPPAPTVPAPPVTTEIKNADAPGSPRYASYAFAAVAVAILALIATRFFN